MLGLTGPRVLGAAYHFMPTLLKDKQKWVAFVGQTSFELQYCATIATQTLGREGHVGIHLLRVCEVWLGKEKISLHFFNSHL